MGRQAAIKRARKLGMKVIDAHMGAEQVAAVLDAGRVPKQVEYEYLTVAVGASVAEAATYLRDLGREIIETFQREDGRWVIKALA